MINIFKFSDNYFLSCLLVICYVSLVNAQEDSSEQCLTPDRIQGVCISIRECQSILRLLPSIRENSQIAEFIRNSGCGFDRTEPKVCCPDDNKNNSEKNEQEFRLPSAELFECGNRSGNIGDAGGYAYVGGTTPNKGDWPWAAALGYRGDDGQLQWLCAGALITSKHVLTAAHCISQARGLYLVRLGELDFNDDNDEAVDIEIEKYFVHEGYNRRAKVADIAIIELKQSAPVPNRYIHPVCLPTSDDVINFESSADDVFVYGAGWGSTKYEGETSKILQEVSLPVVSVEQCREAYAAFPKQIIDRRVVCAGSKEGGIDACSGDSGGPLVYRKKQQNKRTTTQHYVIGIVSYGYRCAEPGIPGVYTRVSEYLPWIRTKIQQ